MGSMSQNRNCGLKEITLKMVRVCDITILALYGFMADRVMTIAQSREFDDYTYNKTCTVTHPPKN